MASEHHEMGVGLWGEGGGVEGERDESGFQQAQASFLAASSPSLTFCPLALSDPAALEALLAAPPPALPARPPAPASVSSGIFLAVDAVGWTDERKDGGGGGDGAVPKGEGGGGRTRRSQPGARVPRRERLSLKGKRRGWEGRERGRKRETESGGVGWSGVGEGESTKERFGGEEEGGGVGRSGTDQSR